MGDLRLVKLMTVTWAVTVGGYSTQALGRTVPGKWTVHHAAEEAKTVGSKDRRWYLLYKYSSLSSYLVTDLNMAA